MYCISLLVGRRDIYVGSTSLITNVNCRVHIRTLTMFAPVSEVWRSIFNCPYLHMHIVHVVDTRIYNAYNHDDCISWLSLSSYGLYHIATGNLSFLLKWHSILIKFTQNFNPTQNTIFVISLLNYCKEYIYIYKAIALTDTVFMGVYISQ